MKKEMATKSREIALDVKKHQQLAKEVKDRCEECLRVLEDIHSKLEGENGEGISLLHLKNLTMVDYLSDLVFVMLKKSSGKSICGDPAIDRIVEFRTVLEKMRPMEKKLKYQIEKYVKLAEGEGSERSDDPLHFKPNLDDLEQSEGEEDENAGSVAAGGGGDGRKKYVVPKHVPTLCEDDLTAREVELEEEKRQRKKTLSRAIVDDLRRQYTDAPEEDFNHSDTLKAKHIRQIKERTRYEEENYTRLPALTKKEKHGRRKSMTTMGVLADEVTFFGSNNFFNEGDPAAATSRGKKRRGGSGGKSKGSAKKRFKRRM